MLAILFFLTACLYATVGFGGGSTYTAILALSHIDYRAIPSLSLICNILVVTVGATVFMRAGCAPKAKAWPLFIFSVPLAWVGGRIHVPERLFVGVLSASLLAAGLAMLFQKSIKTRSYIATSSRWFEPPVGAALGFLSGIVGIGGGIFLAPFLHLTRWAHPRAISATCALFILVNSAAGLAGQLSKGDGFDRSAVLAENWLLFPAVVLGGLIGAQIGSRKLKEDHLRLLTAGLVLYVGARLGLRATQMAGGLS